MTTTDGCIRLRLSGALLAAVLLVAPKSAAQLIVVHDAAGNLLSVSPATAQRPTISAQLRSIVAAPSGVGAFSVSAAGSPPLRYQWFYNRALLAGMTGDSLLITNVSSANVGEYSVTVANNFGSVSSAARLDLDADNDGLADNWEIAHFGSITNQTAALDYDRDGVDNLTEFFEGTNPTNALSLFPRLTVVPYRCAVTIDPLLDKYASGQTVTLTATPDAGQSFIGWSGATNSTSTVVTFAMTANKLMIAQAGLPLTDSLDLTNRVVTGGDALWYGQAAESHDGLSAARSGRVGHRQKSWFATTNRLSGEGTVTFWWTVNSQQDADYLSFYIDDVRQPGRISGAVEWQRRTYYVTGGEHVFRWEYAKSADDGDQFDADFIWSPASDVYTLTHYLSAEDWAGVDEVVWEVPPDPLLDADQDGLPELWEWKYFYSLNDTGLGDPDGDEVNNRDEFLDGTIPTSSISILPRLTVRVEGAGNVTATPAKEKYVYEEVVSLTATPAPGSFLVGWGDGADSTNLVTSVTMFGNQRVRLTFGLPLPPALNAAELVWRSGGSRVWFGQTNVTHDHLSAAQSGPVRFPEESWVETEVLGPGTFSFWSKIEADNNVLRFTVNGVEQTEKSGEVDWEPQVLFLPAGVSTLRWQYLQYLNSTNLANAAWLDEVSYTPGATAPEFRLQPVSQTVFQGAEAVFKVSTRGTPPVLYELLRDGIPTGVNSSTGSLVLSNAAPTDIGSYSVRASNSGGSRTSASVSLAVLPVPPVNDMFAAATGFAGSSNVATGYTVGATGETDEPGSDPHHSVWWKWTAPSAGFFRVAAEARPDQTGVTLGIYQGSDVSQLNEVFRQSESSSWDGSEYVARVIGLFRAAAGQEYAFVLDTGDNPNARVTLTVTLEPAPQNDFFAKRIFLTGGSVTVSGSTVTATREPGEPFSQFGPAVSGSNSVWFAWTPPQSGWAALNWEKSRPYVTVFEGATLSSLIRVTNNILASGAIQFAARGGVTYPFSVDALSQTGDFRVNIALLTPLLSSATLSSTNGVTFSLTGPAGARYTVDRSPDMRLWTLILTSVVPFDGIIRFNDPTAAPDGQNFYRVQIGP